MSPRILVGTEATLFDLADPSFAQLDAPVSLGHDRSGWWAVTKDARVWRSPGALEWSDVTVVRGLRPNCVVPTEDGALVGTSEARLVHLGAEGSAERVRSFDRIATRDEWYTPWGGPADVRSLSRGADGAFYANIHVGGIARSDDGTKWRATPLDIDSDVHQVLAHPETPRLVYAATAIGLATSTDGGESWEFSDEGLHAAYCRAVAIAGDTLLISASKSHTGKQSALYRRPLKGGTFERCAAGLPEWFKDNVDTFCLDARGDDAVLGTVDGRVFVSGDAGVTWSEALKDEPPITCVAIDPN
jgi:hypothetical protein